MSKRKGAVSVAKLKDALIKCHGVMFHAAEMCGVHRHTVKRMCDLHPELEEARQHAEEELIDVGEGQVAAAVKAGDMKTVRWYLERKGKQRGYVTRNETTGADGEPLTFTEIRRTYVDSNEGPPTEELK